MAAVLYIKVKSIKFLIEQGANVNLTDERGNTALHYVASRFIVDIKLQITISQILVENGIDINIKNSKGETALDLAKENNYEEIISLLSSKEEIR